MTFVIFQIFLHKEERVEHWIRIFSLSFDPHEMSSNIDMKIILPVRFSGVSPDLNRKLFDFVTELQRIESWENVPLEVHRLTVDSVKVSVFRR